jgi:peptidyl-dipeptidase A
MKRVLCVAASVAALMMAAPAMAGTQKPATVAEAKAFIANAEKQMAEMSQYVQRAAWVQSNFITDDTEWLAAKAGAESTELQVRLANEAKRFDGLKLPSDVARKLKLLKIAMVLPAPQKPGAARELATITTGLEATYGAGKFTYKGKQIDLGEAEDILASSRDPEELKAVWTGWRTISPPMRKSYAREVEIANAGAKELGFKDTGALWRAGYDMSPDAFAKDTDRLWKQVEPFYKQLHCYVRARLNEKYGDAVQAKTGPIRADLLGNMWAQQWGNINDIVGPKDAALPYDLDKLLVAKGYDAKKMMKTGENFYTSIGLPALPDTFWARSLITKPADRDVVCHASAWDLDDRDDIRVKMCTKVNGEDFYTIHHELGHNYYQRSYKDQPQLFKNGANDGFHEAIGDFIGLSSLTPEYLHQIGLLDTVPAPGAADTAYLLRMALDKVAFLPFGLMIDRWRWQVFSGQTTPETYNADWWKLVKQYQGLVPPVARSEADFDPGAKYHIPGNTPYTRYFLAHILQFQFQKAACDQIGWKGPLHRCSIYGHKEVGAKFDKMMAMGMSKPWPDALETFTGTRNIDGSAIVAYFAPLQTWLVEQNKGQTCGW